MPILIVLNAIRFPNLWKRSTEILKAETFDAYFNEKHTKISSTDHGHGLCYYFFIVEVENRS